MSRIPSVTAHRKKIIMTPSPVPTASWQACSLTSSSHLKVGDSQGRGAFTLPRPWVVGASQTAQRLGLHALSPPAQRRAKIYGKLYEAALGTSGHRKLSSNHVPCSDDGQADEDADSKGNQVLGQLDFLLTPKGGGFPRPRRVPAVSALGGWRFTDRLMARSPHPGTASPAASMFFAAFTSALSWWPQARHRNTA